MKMPLLSDSSGKPSLSFSMLIVAFSILMLWLALSVFEEIGGIPVRDFDGTTAMEVLSPLAALYFGRRWTGAKLAQDNQGSSEKPQDG